jgi:hypothetical protein
VVPWLGKHGLVVVVPWLGMDVVAIGKHGLVFVVR